MKKIFFLTLLMFAVLPSFSLVETSGVGNTEGIILNLSTPALIAEAVGPGGFVPCEGAGCNACDLVTMGETILGWLIGVMLVIFAIIVSWAGFGLVTSGGNVAAKSEAKKKILNALIGIVIVLAAWLIIDTLMRALLAGGTGEIGTYGPWNEIKCAGQTATK